MPERLKILIIDDDPLDREIFKRCLEDSQPGACIFSEAGSGRAGVTRCESFQPDCILLDFNLPDVDGLAILQQWRNNSEMLRFAVVMLTAVGSEQIAVDAMKMGAMDYLTKGPAASESLYRAVRNAVQKFQLQRDLSLQRETVEKRNVELEAIRRDLIKEKEQYRTLTETIPQLVWTARSDGLIEFTNGKLKALIGDTSETPSELISLIHSEDRKGFKAAWEEAVTAGRAFEMELRLDSPNDQDTRRWQLVRALPLKGSKDQPIRWVGTFTDIEEQKRSEEAARQRQKLDSIGLLAGGIAHDFNNLLVGIMGGASLAFDSLDRNHPARDTLDAVIRASERAAHLTQQLLSYAGKVQTFPQPVDIIQLIDDTAALVRASMPKTVHLSIKMDPELPLLEANLGQLQQILMNLMINAAEAIGDRNGLIGVRASMERAAGEGAGRNVLGYEIRPGEYVSIEVSDTGVGMEQETQSRIFDPFFTTKFTGRGLGLAAVQGIVRSIKGAIYVVSAPGKGSSFTVLLPANRLSRTVSPLSPAPAPSLRAKILIIDDEAIVRTTARASLERAGHSVLLAEDGPQALACFDEHKRDVSLILLDMSMPLMSGPEVLKEIRRLSRDVPVAIMSGYSEHEMAERFEGSKVAGYIQKPFKANALIAGVNMILGVGTELHSVGPGHADSGGRTV